MCEYCEKGVPLVIGKTNDYGITIYRDGVGREYLNAYGYGIHGMNSNGLEVKINYCPMCGRKLETKDEYKLSEEEKLKYLKKFKDYRVDPEKIRIYNYGRNKS